MHRLVRVIGALLMALLVTACSNAGGPSSLAGGASSSAGSSSAGGASSSVGAASLNPGGFAAQMAWHEGDPTPDGCLVVSSDEVSATSGFQIVRTQRNLNDQPGCAYYDADGLVLSTRFHQRDTGDGNFAAEMARTPVAVPGIGDQAIWIERAWNLWAWQGDTLVMMGVGRIGETPARFELAKKLAALVVPRFDGDASP